MGIIQALETASLSCQPKAEHLKCYVKLFYVLHALIEDAFGGDGETEWTEAHAQDTLRRLRQSFRNADLPERTTAFQHVFAQFLDVLWDSINPDADETVVGLFLRASEARKQIAVFKQCLEALSDGIPALDV